MFHSFGRAVRETGQAIDRIGLIALEKPIFKEPFSRHRAVMNLFEKHPWTSADVFVAPSASVIGDVDINMRSSVMYGAVLRGDNNKIDIGAFTTIGDKAVISTVKTVEGRPDAVTRIGDYVTIGAGALLQSCVVESRAKIGAGAVVMEGAVVEEYAEVAPGAVVHPGRRVPKGQLWAGNPAVYVQDLSKSDMGHHEEDAQAAADLAVEHATEFLPVGSVYLDAEKKAAI